MADDDDQEEFDVAVDSGGGDDAGDDGHVLPATGHRQTRGARVYSEATRAAFQKASQAIKEQIAEDDDEFFDPVDAQPDDDPAPVQQGAPSAPAAAAPVAAAPPPVAPAAPSLDPGIIAERDRLAADRQAFEAERASLRERAERDPIGAFRARYHDNSAAAVQDLLKEALGGAEGDELKDAVADLVVDLSATVLGLSVSNEVRGAADSRRALRAIKAHKAETKKSEEQRVAEQKTAQERDQDRQTVSAIGRELEAAKTSYPFLTAEDDPAGFIWDVIKDRRARTGEVLSWPAAAQLAEDSFKRYAETWFARRRHLVAPSAPVAGPGAAATANGNGTRERPNQGQGRTVTNAMAAAATAPTEVERTRDDRPLTNEERRAATKAKMRAAYRAHGREEA